VIGVAVGLGAAVGATDASGAVVGEGALPASPTPGEAGPGLVAPGPAAQAVTRNRAVMATADHDADRLIERFTANPSGFC
jgi:hypothetical protein